MRLNSTKLLLVGAFALMASLSFAQVVEPTDSTKVGQDENVSLNETLIIGKGVIDVSENRKTPVASTVITREQILDKGVGNVEFPELLKNSPSIYIADQASGFGDAKMYMRGFDQSNTAFLLNGQPINGMDNGSLYWSNWQSVSDIANVIDAQRGLGSSKLAISSVGGTVNIVTKATDKKEGGFVRYLAGNDSYQKQTIGYNTGMKGKWGASFMFDNWSAHRSFARGTEGKGQSYFVSVGYKPNEHHTFNFMIFGAPQQHDQNFSKPMESKRDKNGVVTTPGYDITGRKGNSNYGFYNGESMSARTNYYHKPVANLNWDWAINDKMSLSTVVYASTGTGGGVGVSGNGIGYTPGGGYTSNGEINWANVYANNATLKDGISDGYRNGTVLASSVNNHFWYGGVSNFTYDTKKGLTFNAGTDIRFYTGEHYQQLNDLLGARVRTDVRNANVSRPAGYEVTKTFSADPWNSLFNKAKRSERIGFDNSERINYQGFFGQAEYSNELFSVFFQGALSWQEYEKYDNWNYTAERAEKEGIKFKNGKAYSGEHTQIGYNLKAGASLNINKENSVFVNVGKYSRQPYLNNIFVRNTVNYIDTGINNEILQSVEAGYRYKSRTLRVNVNAYYTEWDNRSMTYNGQDFKDGNGNPHSNVRFIATGLSEVHKGIEADFEAKVTRDWTITGYASTGDWMYKGKYNFQVQDTDTQDLLPGFEGKESSLDAHVGNAAQFTFGMGTRVNVTKGLSFDTNFNYYARLYENVDLVDAVKAATEGKEYVNVPIRPFATVDLGMSYKFKITNSQSIKFRGNVNNLFNDQYISRKDNYGYFWGNGRTWNAGVTYNF
ncbi:TonB-dependent receptor [Empedobacter brevis NBRC 14943 = ATCC 43319]|uniref:TonB-dependent receptor n=1 Tax=Empedobacter brevis NBRC 14943 = ATCC 43319 TaxID=1218108 RepID=A0A511NJ26_9FLAO|nr:TonB-dependent receptor [Empedobacter brevis]GEM52779.1 TonB-dependent receptor [Empedobacter brevis NBRC 14943 = ATCC 43319]